MLRRLFGDHEKDGPPAGNGSEAPSSARTMTAGCLYRAHVRPLLAAILTFGPVLTQALEASLWKQRQMDQGRVAGFAKRLAGGSLATADTAAAVAELFAL